MILLKVFALDCATDTLFY